MAVLRRGAPAPIDPAWFSRLARRIARWRSRREILKQVAIAAPARRIVVFGTRDAYLVARRLTRRQPASRVLVISPRCRRRPPRDLQTAAASSVRGVRRVLQAHPAPDLFIECGSGRSCPPVSLFESVLPMLADGATYLLVARAGEGAEVFDGCRSRIRQLAELGERPSTPPGADDVALAACIASVELSRSLVVVQRRGEALIKLRDVGATAAMTRRLGAGRVRELDVRESLSVDTESRLWVNDPGVDNDFRPRFEVPNRYLRLYRDAVCTPRQLAVVGDLVAPISFHHPQGRRLRNRHIVDVGPHAAVPQLSLADPVPLSGTYYHLVSEFPGHFGHVMTEDVGRLWGWDRARQEFEDLRLLVGVNHPGQRPPGFFYQLLRAYGIAESDVTVIDRPARVERLVGATPQFHNGKYVDPHIDQIWSRLARALVRSEADTPKRLFVTRPPRASRVCHNADEVEAVFVDRGFSLVQPGELSLTEQATLFAHAEVVAGYGGSALFNAVFAPRPIRRIVICSESYYASNEWLISAVKGDEYYHFWCPADVARAATFDNRSFHSPFTFDFARDGQALGRALGGTRMSATAA